MLHNFRNNAGVYAGLEGGYESVKKFGGWESRPSLTLHTMPACYHNKDIDQLIRLKSYEG